MMMQLNNELKNQSESHAINETKEPALKGNFSEVTIPRLMLVGTGSGCGKTTLACGLLQGFKAKGLNLAAFKCGPDYIDPMFHTKALGVKSSNLDLFLCGEKAVRHLFATNSLGADLAIIEGVMGLYDGLGTTMSGSSNELALATLTPEILVVNPKGMSLTLIAQLEGYLKFALNRLKGVILNPASEGTYSFLKPIIEEKLGLQVFGYLPQLPDATLASRHLGLITADEVEDIQRRLELLGNACLETIDLDGLYNLAKANASFSYQPISLNQVIPLGAEPLKIGVARDKAFCFYYQDNLALLKALGAELVEFSPLEDKKLPLGLAGLILGGGYPEEYAQKLGENIAMKQEIKQVVCHGLPTVAECGGFMYLGESIKAKDGVVYPMTGCLPVKSTLTQKLNRFGYIKLVANEANLLCGKGETINGHEFHYSDSDNNGSTFTATKQNGKFWQAIYGTDTLFAGYPHLHWWGNLGFAQNFVQKCWDYKHKKGI